MIIGPSGYGAGSLGYWQAQAAASIAGTATPESGTLYPGTVILSTSEDSGPDASGNYVDGRTVTFQIATGDVASVWVPYSSLTPAVVAAAVNSVAEALSAIWLLNNPGT